MRSVSRRFQARLLESFTPVTEVSWSNDGGHTWTPCTFLGGNVVVSALDQIRWKTTLTLEAPAGRGGVNAFTTRLKVMHGMTGEPLLPMGRYKVTLVKEADETPGLIEVSGSSFEVYLMRARFETMRVFKPTSASLLVTNLIREVLPEADVHWQADDLRLPKITEERDRWALIDGDRDEISAARAVGARVYTGPHGEWLARPIATLEDAAVWEANRGEALLTAERELSDDNVYNIFVVNGETTDDKLPFPPGIAKDLDPQSLTYAGLSPDSGGFGPSTSFYTSQLMTSWAQAQRTAQTMLAPYLGLRQKIDFTRLHNPLLEPGDVGLVTSRLGTERVLLDSLTFDLLGGPTTGETRTTQTRLAGDVSVAVDAEGGE